MIAWKKELKWGWVSSASLTRNAGFPFWKSKQKILLNRETETEKEKEKDDLRGHEKRKSNKQAATRLSPPPLSHSSLSFTYPDPYSP
jgi:hypothetical protein